VVDGLRATITFSVLLSMAIDEFVSILDMMHFPIYYQFKWGDSVDGRYELHRESCDKSALLK
jgi:hypothetical protein